MRPEKRGGVGFETFLRYLNSGFRRLRFEDTAERQDEGAESPAREVPDDHDDPDAEESGHAREAFEDKSDGREGVFRV